MQRAGTFNEAARVQRPREKEALHDDESRRDGGTMDPAVVIRMRMIMEQLTSLGRLRQIIFADSVADIKSDAAENKVEQNGNRYRETESCAESSVWQPNG